MISTFKPAGRLAVAASLALLIALGCFTFTRAADQAGTAQRPEKTFAVTIDHNGIILAGVEKKPVNLEQLKAVLRVEIERDPRIVLLIQAERNTSIEPIRKVLDAAQEMKIHTISLSNGDGAGPEELKAGTQTTPSSDSAGNSELWRGIEIFQKEMKNYELQIKDQERIVDDLRQKFGIVDTDPQASGPAPTLSATTIHTIQNNITEAEIQAAGLKTMLPRLKELSQEQLRQTLPTVVPDQILTTLLQDRNSAETTLVKQLNNLGTNHPDVQTTKSLIEKLDSQIGERVQGILGGIQFQIDSKKSQIKELERMIENAKDKDLEVTARTRPYWLAKAKLEQLKRLEEDLFFRVGHEKMNLSVPANEGVK